MDLIDYALIPTLKSYFCADYLLAREAPPDKLKAQFSSFGLFAGMSCDIVRCGVCLRAKLEDQKFCRGKSWSASVKCLAGCSQQL
jgi:hypothetical protein